MKYYLPLLLLTPFSAHAHPQALPHVHHASYEPVLFGVALIAISGLLVLCKARDNT